VKDWQENIFLPLVEMAIIYRNTLISSALHKLHGKQMPPPILGRLKFFPPPGPFQLRRRGKPFLFVKQLFLIKSEFFEHRE
jgi:hypothetical protein